MNRLNRNFRASLFVALGIISMSFSFIFAGDLNPATWKSFNALGIGIPELSLASGSGVVWGSGSGDDIANSALYASIDSNPQETGDQPAELSDGESIRVEGMLADLKGVAPTVISGELRFGLFYSRGNTNTEGWLGYFLGNSASNGRAVFYRRSPGNKSLFVSLAGASPIAYVDNTSGTNAQLTDSSYRFSIQLSRIGASLRYDASLVRVEDGQLFADFHGVDSAPSTFVFDRIGFLCGKHLSADQVRLKDIRVTFESGKVAASRGTGEAKPVTPKQALPAGVTVISPDGAWTWFNDERAIWHQGNLFAGYVTQKGEVGIARYDTSTGTAFSHVLGSARSIQADDHNNPSLVSRADGRLLAVYSKHGAAKEYYTRISLKPDPASPADWAPEQIVSVPAPNTYANAFQLTAEGDKIFSFHRCLNWNPTLSISDNGGATWQSPIHFITAGQNRSVRPYIRLVSNNVDRIDLTYTDGHPRDIENLVYHLYYKGGAVFRTNGEQIKTLAQLPLDHARGETGSVVYAYSPDFGRGWVWDVQYGPQERPVCVYQTRRADVTGTGWQHGRIYYHYSVWNGTEWRSTFIAQGGRALYARENDYGGGMAIDPDDPRVVYISTNAARPFDLAEKDHVPLAPDERYELWRGFTADGGLTFTWQPVTRDSAEDNIRPAVPSGHGGVPGLLWVRGRYTSYTDYQTRIVACLQSLPNP